MQFNRIQYRYRFRGGMVSLISLIRQKKVQKDAGYDCSTSCTIPQRLQLNFFSTENRLSGPGSRSKSTGNALHWDDMCVQPSTNDKISHQCVFGFLLIMDTTYMTFMYQRLVSILKQESSTESYRNISVLFLFFEGNTNFGALQAHANACGLADT